MARLKVHVFSQVFHARPQQRQHCHNTPPYLMCLWYCLLRCGHVETTLDGLLSSLIDEFQFYFEQCCPEVTKTAAAACCVSLEFRNLVGRGA